MAASGSGDGFYNLFWGLDESGNPVCLGHERLAVEVEHGHPDTGRDSAAGFGKYPQQVRDSFRESLVQLVLKRNQLLGASVVLGSSAHPSSPDNHPS